MSPGVDTVSNKRILILIRRNFRLVGTMRMYVYTARGSHLTIRMSFANSEVSARWKLSGETQLPVRRETNVETVAGWDWGPERMSREPV